MSSSYQSHASSVGSSRSGSGTTMPDSNTSLTSSIQMRGENSTCSSSYVNELSLPSSFASSSANSSRRGGGGGGGGIVRLGPNKNDGVESGIYQPSSSSSGGGGSSSMADSFNNMSLHSQQQRGSNNNRNNNEYHGSSNRSVNSNYSSSNHSMNRSQQQNEFGGSRHNSNNNDNSGALEIYNASAQGILSTQTEEEQGNNEIISTNNDDNNDNSSLTSSDALALRISKETKPMHHLLRLLKDMEPATTGHDPKDRARASLISDFEQEVQVIEHRMKDENMIMNGEQPPLPPNWIALEDPDSGDVYYANEATGETQWERPGLITELKDRLQDMNNSQLSIHNNQSYMSNQNYDQSNNNNNNNSTILQNSQMSNNYETRGSGTTTASTSEEGMMGSSSDNYDYSEQKQSQNNHMSSNSNNYNLNNSQQEGMHNSQMSNNMNGSNNNNNNNNASNNNFEESKTTLQSSLTDSNHGAAGDLPPDWIALEDPETGEMYYANEVTGESTWDRPISSMPPNNNKAQQQAMPQSMPENDLNRSGNSNSIDHRSQQQQEQEEEELDDDDDDDNDDDLPPDWIALEDADSGDTYYLNQNTMETTWDRPSNEDEHADDADDNNLQTNNNNLDEQSLDHITMGSGEPVSNHGDLPPGWEAVLDETSGDYYYAHESSGETTWDRPMFQSSSSVGNNVLADEVQEQEEEEEEEDADNHDDSLPPGWFGAVDEDSGDQYYCNEVTGETTWDFPTEPAIPDTEPVESPVEVDGGDDDDDDDLPPGWFAVTDPSSGDLYYCNEASGETMWDRPTGGDPNLMSRLSLNDTTVYEDDSVTSSQY